MFVTVNIEKIEISCTRRVVAVGAIAPGCPPKGTLPGVGPPGWAASTRSHKRGGEEVSYATRLVWQHRFDGNPFVVGKLIAHDSKLPSLGA
jgi:hypothetical protein